MEQRAINQLGRGSEVAQQSSAADSSVTPPLIQIKDLQTYFFMREGIVKAVDGANLEVRPGKTLGVVGESGCGKSITSKSILQIVDKPGRIVDGQILYPRQEGPGQTRTIDLLQLPADGPEMRSIRGGEISMIFQEPMTSFSPVHTVGNQIVEAIRLHRKIDKNAAATIAEEWL